MGRTPPAEFEALYRDCAGAIYSFVAGMLRDRSAELRRRGRIAELPPDPDDRTSPGPPELAMAGARRAVVLRALDTLEPHERDPVTLRFDGRLSHAEIGEVLDVTATNASTMLHRAVIKLRKACDEMA